MADVADTVPPALDESGNITIWWVPNSPGIADLEAPDADTEIGAATSFRVTHSFTTSGFALAGSQVIDTDERFALAEALESLGKLTNTLGTLEYVDSTAAGSAAVVLKPSGGATSISGYFVIRRGVAIATLAAATQKVQVVPVTLGPQVKPTTGTGKLKIQQQSSITGPIVEGVLA